MSEKNERFRNLIDENTPFVITEAYKSTRTNLLFSNSIEGGNVIVFTSASSSEGKTINCVNMGIELAELGKKVLIVDSDMRKSQVAQTLGIVPVPGLSELLSGIVDMVNLVQCCQRTKYENLDVLCSGLVPPNPAELISGGRMETLMSAVKERYDYILVDSPPVLVVSDSLLYKPYATGYVLVVRSNKSKIEEISKLVNRMKQVEVHIIGFVLNDVTLGSKKYSSYQKYDNYGKKQK